jgi:hypothetical protein
MSMIFLRLQENGFALSFLCFRYKRRACAVGFVLENGPKGEYEFAGGNHVSGKGILLSIAAGLGSFRQKQGAPHMLPFSLLTVTRQDKCPGCPPTG